MILVYNLSRDFNFLLFVLYLHLLQSLPGQRWAQGSKIWQDVQYGLDFNSACAIDDPQYQ